MAYLVPDLKNRVKRLPKPSNLADGLQPVFEAVSNGLDAIQERFNDTASRQGKVTVEFINIGNPDNLEVIITDNGIGLDKERFEAFCTLDTGFKIKSGGKGIGRILWLAAFEKITVESHYKEISQFYKRSFSFGIGKNEPVYNEQNDPVEPCETGTQITLKTLTQEYRGHPPNREGDICNHFASHLISQILASGLPRIEVVCSNNQYNFPEQINNIKRNDLGAIDIDAGEYGQLALHGFVLDKRTSFNLDGKHQLHLTARGRTVETRKIDSLLGNIQIDDEESIYHGVLSGQFLEERVNQERTRFNFDETITKKITKICVTKALNSHLQEAAKKYHKNRQNNMKNFLNDYPSFGFAGTDELISKVPQNANDNEAFAKALIPYKIRREKQRDNDVNEILKQLNSGEYGENIAELIKQTADQAQQDERLQLMEYVVRRKIIIDIMQALLGLVREKGKEKRTTHLEKTLHNLICPMKITGDQIDGAAHDLWLIDERLTSAIYFSSDKPLNDVSDNSDKIRPDLFVWDNWHGLGIKSEEGMIERVMLVEFKRPERDGYKDEPVERQLIKYIQNLQKKKVRGHDGKIIEISPNAIFYCYVIADLVGDLKTDTEGWKETPNGRGRYKFLDSQTIKGFIEIIPWMELVRDAKMRNKAFIEQAGMRYRN